MIRNVLSNTNGVGLYGLIAILLFFTTFTGVLIWAFTRKRSLMQELGALPLSDEEVRHTPSGEPRDESVQ